LILGQQCCILTCNEKQQPASASFHLLSWTWDTQLIASGNHNSQKVAIDSKQQDEWTTALNLTHQSVICTALANQMSIAPSCVSLLRRQSSATSSAVKKHLHRSEDIPFFFILKECTFGAEERNSLYLALYRSLLCDSNQIQGARTTATNF
jgi:hypothetical protein